MTTVALSAVARGVATALDPPAVIPVRQTTEPQREPEHVDQEHQDITIPVSHPALGDLWPAWRPQQHIRRPRPPIPAHPLAVAAVVVMLLGVVLVLDVQARGPSSPQVPSATMLQRHVLTYPQGRGGRSTYIGTALYVATTAVLSGHPIPWAAWGSCPTGFDGARCARSEVTLYGSNGQARAEAIRRQGARSRA